MNYACFMWVTIASRKVILLLENSNLLRKGKYLCTAEFGCFTYVELTTCLVESKTSQRRGQLFSDTSLYKECERSWLSIVKEMED